MTTVLVTGATGYLGQHLIARLQQEPTHRLIGLVRSPVAEATGWTPRVGTMEDTDFETWFQADPPDVVYHMAAAPRTASYEQQVNVTVTSTCRLLTAIGQHAPEARIVIPGSAAEYGPSDELLHEDAFPRAKSDYGLAKLGQTSLASAMAEHENIHVCVGRIFNVYGQTSPDLALAALCQRIATLEATQPEDPVLQAYNLQSVRDFVHLNDVLSALIGLATLGRAGEIYNIGNGSGTPLFVIADYLLNQSTLPHIRVETQGEQVEDISVADNQKLIAEIGWTPTVSLADGLDREMAYWRAQVAACAMRT